MDGEALNGRYQIENLIAKGLNGEIFRAVDTTTNQTVAIKVLQPKSASQGEFVARFYREIELLESLNHPNSVKIFDRGTNEAGLPFVVMEFIEGETLTQVIEREGKISPRRLANIVSQVCSVLEAAHAKKIIHRDIKPSNIMVSTQEDGAEVAKVLDFGFAKIVGDGAQAASNLTSFGVAVGTPTYMSPEQALGRPVDRFTDQYSLGVTMFASLTGRLPYDGKNSLQIMLSHVKDPIPKFSERNPHNTVHACIEAVVRRAMGKETNERYGSAHELARVFQEVVEKYGDVDAEPEPITDVKPEDPKPSPILFLVTGVLIAIFVGILAGVLFTSATK